MIFFSPINPLFEAFIIPSSNPDLTIIFVHRFVSISFLQCVRLDEGYVQLIYFGLQHRPRP